VDLESGISMGFLGILYSFHDFRKLEIVLHISFIHKIYNVISVIPKLLWLKWRLEKLHIGLMSSSLL